MQTQEIVKSGELELAVYSWGKFDAKKPTIVLVHGYPDSASVWSKTAQFLAEDFYVISYDVRGAGRSSRPQAVEDYALEYLVDDLAVVVDAVSPDKPVHLVGHDWGSIQSWEAVTTPRLQGRIASYTSISGPSLDHAGYWISQRLASRSLADKQVLLKQLLHSWYIGAFHLPALAPAVWKTAGDKLWPVLLQRLEGIREATPNATQSADGQHGVKLYRANVRKRVFQPNQRHTDIPVHLLFPLRDRFMIEEIWQDLPQWAPNLWRSDVEAGHWVQVSHPQLVADKVSDFVRHIEGEPPSRAMQHAKVRAQQQDKAQASMPVTTGA